MDEHAATPPTTPSAAAMRAAEEWLRSEWAKYYGGDIDEGVNALAAIITRHLAAAPAALCRASLSCRSGEGRAKVELQFSELRDAQAVHKWLANTRNAAATPSPETAAAKEGWTPEQFARLMPELSEEERASILAETAVGGEAQKCVKCGHELLPDCPLNELGQCQVSLSTSIDSNIYDCGCACDFTAPVPDAVDDEGECPFCERMVAIEYKMEGRFAAHEAPTDRSHQCVGSYAVASRELLRSGEGS